MLAIFDIVRNFDGVAALRKASLSVEQGTITALIGPNGAGKTTLVNIVSGLDRPDAGSIRFAEQEITRLSPDKVSRAGLVRTFQTSRGFPKLTVFDHLMIYGPRHPGDRLYQSLFGTRRSRQRERELADRAMSIARRFKLDNVLSHRVTAISGGQRKLLEIGRALMAEPRLILLDEPTAGVNPSLKGEIAGHLAELRSQGVTMLLIEHDMQFISQLADQVIVMAEGSKLTEGTFSEIVEDERVQAAYLGRRPS